MAVDNPNDDSESIVSSNTNRPTHQSQPVEVTVTSTGHMAFQYETKWHALTDMWDDTVVFVGCWNFPVIPGNIFMRSIGKQMS